MFYNQIDGVVLGLPLALILANISMGFHERNWLHNYFGTKPLFYRRYVDDIFCIFHNEEDAMLFFDYLNSRHRNIKFTFEKEENGKLPFLDVLLSKSSDTYTTSVYHKETYIGLLMSYLSFCPHSYKTGLIRTLTDRIRRN